MEEEGFLGALPPGVISEAVLSYDAAIGGWRSGVPTRLLVVARPAGVGQAGDARRRSRPGQIVGDARSLRAPQQRTLLSGRRSRTWTCRRSGPERRGQRRGHHPSTLVSAG